MRACTAARFGYSVAAFSWVAKAEMFGTATLRSDLYPPIEPSETGRLELDRRPQHVLGGPWATPRGRPAVFLHGGPGAGAAPDHRRFFDPAHYRIVVYDQRGAGRSTPLGETTDNTTQHLIADLERCASTSGIEAGWSSAAPGAAPWPWPMPRPIPERTRR